MEKLRFGMSSCGFKELTEEDFKSISEAGVKDVEISAWSNNLEKNKNLDWEGIKERADKYGVNLWSYHLPFGPFEEIDISSVDEKLRTSTVSELKHLIEKAASVGIRVMVIHPSGEPYEENERKDRLECAKRSLKELAELADKVGAVIAVEDLPRTCLGRDSYDIKELISADDRLKVCFDTNHILSQPIKEFILDVGDRIVTTHISDYDFKDERHWLPGEGDIDWVELVTELEKAGYEGPLLYELGFGCPKSINRERNLTIYDFKENHQGLVDKAPLKSIGTPNEEVCIHWTKRVW